MNNLVDSGIPFHDPVKRRSYRRRHQLWRFYREDAKAVPVSARPPLPEPGLPPAPPPLPSTLSTECARRWRQLGRERERLLWTLTEQRPEALFAASPPSPGLAERVARWSGKALGRDAARLPFTLECRGTICAMSPGAADDPLAMKWQCRPSERGPSSFCVPDRDASGWYGVLEKESRDLRRLRWPTRVGDRTPKPAYFAVQPPERPSSWHAALAFLESFDWRAALARCAARFEGTGTLATMTEFTEVTGDEPAPVHPTIHAGGDLAGTPLGTCATDALRAAAAAFAIPPTSNGLVLYGDVNFPLDASALDAKIARIRKQIEEEEARPAF